MAFSSLALAGAGAASNVIGSYYSAKSSKAQLNLQADMADINARLAEKTAQSALSQGQQQVAQATMRAGQIKSAQRVALAANGVDLGVGNAAELQASTEIMKEIDKNTIEANAVRTAWGYRTQGVNYQNEATMKRASAGAISPGMAATSTLLSEAGKVASSWYAMNKVGATNNTPSNDPIYDMGKTRGWWKE